jgi:hypothetical protein
MKGSKNEFGYGDLLLGGLGGIAGHAAGVCLGSPAGLGLVLARPTVRHMLLSKPFQSERMTMADLAQLAEPARKSLMVAPALGLQLPQEQP